MQAESSETRCGTLERGSAHEVGNFRSVASEPEEAGLTHDIPQDDVCVL